LVQIQKKWKNLKKKVVLLTQRAQSAEQTRDNLSQKWNNYEQEKLDYFKTIELAEQTYQILQSQNTKLSAEIELYKQETKSSTNSQDLSSLRKLQEQNSTLQSKIDELCSELEKEKSDKAMVIAEMRAKMTLLEANDKSASLSQRLANLPSHPKKEMADARAELATKDRKIAALEISLTEIQGKSALLADQLNRICDEVEKSEKIISKMEMVSKENETLKQENNYYCTDITALKEELVQKENEITTLLDDNDKMVAQLFTLGFRVQVEDDNTSLRIIPINPINTPTITKSSNPTTESKKNNSKVLEDLSGLSIDELLNGWEKCWINGEVIIVLVSKCNIYNLENLL